MINLSGSKILVTGGTGSWGQTLISLLLKRYDVREIVCFSRNENQQVLMKRQHGSKVKFVLGDVRDSDAILNATAGADFIFHLAALKHVPLCEEMPHETIKTNINGTQNVINAALKNKVSKVIYVSSDKAVEPINVYGMTKAVGEKLIIQANCLSDYTKFVCIRGGNVMGSSGSVIPLFIDRLKQKLPLLITDKNMTRFFLTLEQAIQLLFKAVENSIGGETFVMNMPSCYINDLAEVLMEHYGKTEIKITGMRPGEKLDEILVSKYESPLAYRYDDNYYVILPSQPHSILFDKYINFPSFQHEEFSSVTQLMNKKDIHLMLQKGNFV